MKKQKVIALVAHDNRKKDMIEWATWNWKELIPHKLICTGTTGKLVEEATGLPVHKYLAGHLGGEHQLGAQIAHNEIDLVIFLRDPLSQKHYEPDINSALRLCDVHNIPLASNLATAEALLQVLDRGEC